MFLHMIVFHVSGSIGTSREYRVEFKLAPYCTYHLSHYEVKDVTKAKVIAINYACFGEVD
jgi:hypothetical protein